VSGSLTIYYDSGRICQETILHKITQAGYFDRSKAITNDQYIFSAASSALSFVALFI
jgi:hypothetical protein